MQVVFVLIGNIIIYIMLKKFIKMYEGFSFLSLVLHLCTENKCNILNPCIAE